MPDPGLAGAVLLGLAFVLAALIVWAVDRRRQRGRAEHPQLHSLGRDETIGYFRDYGDSAGGVREEDRQHRWGEEG